MQIQCDTREHKSEWVRIEKQFKELGVQYFRSKLFVGDYMNLDNPRLVIDRKKDLNELCGNVCQQHERFRAELVRAQEQGIKIIILCENGKDITCLEDVMFWTNPRHSEWIRKLRMKHMKYRHLSQSDFIQALKSEGVPKNELIPPTSGEQLYKSFRTIQNEYNVSFAFCAPEETGKEIIRLLGGG